MTELVVEPLTRGAFGPFGDVIELAGARHYPINGGTCERYHDLARVDVAEGGGRPLLNIFRGAPRALPFVVELLERHPLGSQAFVPLSGRPYLVVVAPPGPLERSAVLAFLARGDQGVSYARGVWHHALLALESPSDFLVVDRGGEGDNCDEQRVAPFVLTAEAVARARL